MSRTIPTEHPDFTAETDRAGQAAIYRDGEQVGEVARVEEVAEHDYPDGTRTPVSRDVWIVVPEAWWRWGRPEADPHRGPVAPGAGFATRAEAIAAAIAEAR